MQRTKPPFRADHVGSLLRPAALKEARAKHAKGEIDRRAAQGGRGPRDREGHQEAGGDRPQARHRRRIPPLLVAVRFLQGARRRRALFDRRGHQVRRRRDQGRERARQRQDRLLDHPHLDHFRFVKDHTKVTPKMTIPAPSTFHFRQGRQSISKEVYPDLDALFPRRGAGLPQGDPRVLRRRLPLSAARRYRLVDDLRPEGAGGLAQARRRSGHAAGEIHAHDQRGARRPARRHGHHHAFLPRQFPLHLHRQRRLRACGGTPPRQASGSTAISSNTTATGPAASSRCGSFPRATSRSCSAW